MGKSRSAHHALNGFHYQFDKSIIEILNDTSNSEIVLEGIEDIDVGDKAIQCKYHATQSYQRSKIRKPILAFLKHFKSTNTPLKYRLYAHFKENSNFQPIDLTELKSILGTDLASLNLKDTSLQRFLTRHFHYEKAVCIESQRKQVHAAIASALACGLSESELYFYSNALHEVIRLSRQETTEAKTTSRDAFISTINHRRTLFSIWLCQLRSEKQYANFVRDEMRSKDANAPSKSRMLWLDNRFVVNSGVSGIVKFCGALVERQYKLGHALYNSVPPCIILESDLETVAKVKAGLIAENIWINDGYEHLAFNASFFNSPPIVNRKMTRTRTPRALDKVDCSSYQLRMIGRDTFQSHSVNINSPDSLFLTKLDSILPFEPSVHTDVFQLTEVSDLDQLSKILMG